MRGLEASDVPKIGRLLFILFELPQDKIAFRLITTEILIDLSFALGDIASSRDGPSDELIAETQKYYTYVIEGLSVATARQQSAQCLMKLVEKTKSYMHPFCEQVITNALPRGDALARWKYSTATRNVLTALAYLICRVTEAS